MTTGGSWDSSANSTTGTSLTDGDANRPDHGAAGFIFGPTAFTPKGATGRRFRVGEQFHPKATLVALAFGVAASTALTALRLHNMGQQPLAGLLVLVPFVGMAVVIWCALSPGQPHNPY